MLQNIEKENNFYSKKTFFIPQERKKSNNSWKSFLQNDDLLYNMLQRLPCQRFSAAKIVIKKFRFYHVFKHSSSSRQTANAAA